MQRVSSINNRLKAKLEAKIRDLVSYKRRRDIVVAFDQHMEDVVTKACERDYDSEALQAARTAALIRRDIFDEHKELFNGSFPSNCQARRVLASLKALVSMILEILLMRRQQPLPVCQLINNYWMRLSMIS